MNVYKFIGKDTRQQVIYMPSFELSGYGETFEKAYEMLKFSVNNLFEYTISLPSDEIEKELSKYGWADINC